MQKISFKYCFLFALTLVLKANLYAQDANSDLSAIQKVYMGEQAICVDLHYYKHVNTVKSNALEQFSGPACFKKESSYQMVDSVESIINKNYSLIVDHKYKTILRRELSEQEIEQLKAMNSSTLDFSNFLENYKVNDYKKFAKDSAVYTFKSLSAENPHEINLVFNPKNYNILELQVKYLIKQDVESATSTYFGFPIIRVVYKNHKKVKKDKLFFTETKYLKKVGDIFEATKEYKGYEVVAN